MTKGGLNPLRGLGVSIASRDSAKDLLKYIESGKAESETRVLSKQIWHQNALLPAKDPSSPRLNENFNLRGENTQK